MGGKQSTTTQSTASPRASTTTTTTTTTHRTHTGGASSSVDARQRARSLSSVLNGVSSGQLPIPAGHSSVFALSGSPDSEASTPDDSLPFGRVFAAHSLPVQLVSFNGIKCPVCSKTVLPDDVECHLVMCLTKPRISYNGRSVRLPTPLAYSPLSLLSLAEDILNEDKGECVICFEELVQGDTIARLPCLCIYHKVCIDAWFEVNRSCPEHPLD